MLRRNDSAYLLRREDEKRSRAAAAKSEAEHDRHFVLAERFADRAWAVDEGYL